MRAGELSTGARRLVGEIIATTCVEIAEATNRAGSDGAFELHRIPADVSLLVGPDESARQAWKSIGIQVAPASIERAFKGEMNAIMAGVRHALAAANLSLFAWRGDGRHLVVYVNDASPPKQP